jgi:hypothetical protein
MGLVSISVQIRHYPRAEGKVKIIRPEGWSSVAI